MKAFRAVKAKKVVKVMSSKLKLSNEMKRYTEQQLKITQRWPQAKFLRYLSEVTKAANKPGVHAAIAKRAKLINQGRVNNAFKVKLPPKYTQALAAIYRKYGLKPPPIKRFA